MEAKTLLVDKRDQALAHCRYQRQTGGLTFLEPNFQLLFKQLSFLKYLILFRQLIDKKKKEEKNFMQP